MNASIPAVRRAGGRLGSLLLGLLGVLSTASAAAGEVASSTTTDALRPAPMPEGAAPSMIDGQPTVRPTPEGRGEEGFPRAPMPEGAAPSTIDGQPAVRPTPEGGVDDGLRRAPMPAGAAPGLGPIPAGRSLPEAPPPAGPKRKFGDYAEETAQEGLRVDMNGFLRVVVEALQNDDGFDARNDGFRIANARIGVRARQGRLLAYASLDAAVGDRETYEDIDETYAVMPRDLLLRYRLAEFASITLGRFKTPYDLGQLELTAYRLFIDAPVESRGVLPSQGVAAVGLRQGRQLGGMVHRARIGLDPDGFDLGYALALTNGRANGLEFNDNDRVAGFGRLSLYWAQIVQVNVAGFFDDRTVVDGGATVDEDARGLEVSALVQGAGFSLEGQILLENVGRADLPDADAWGAHAQVAYAWGAFLVAYRIAHLDPDGRDNAVTEHTASLGYDAASIPLRVLVNGTLADERARVRVDNHRLAMLVQVTF